MNNKPIYSEVLTIKEIFSGSENSELIPRKSVYYIPSNQRAYEWNNKNLNELYMDLYENYLKKDNEYYLGNIILDSKNGIPYKTDFEIQDGQQRITTIYLYFSALKKFLSYYSYKYDGTRTPSLDKNKKVYDLDSDCNNMIFNKSNDFKVESGIAKKFVEELLNFTISNNDSFVYDNIGELFRISTDTSSNSSDFGKIIRDSDNYRNNKKLRYVDSNILNAYIYFYNVFYDSWVDINDVKPKNEPPLSNMTIFKTEPGIDVYKYTKYLLKSVLINVIRLEEKFSHKKFKIFETINARGQALKESDKLKNHILAHIDEHHGSKVLSKALNHWGEIVEKTDTLIEKFVSNMVLIEANQTSRSKGVVEFPEKNTYDVFKERTENEKIDYFQLLKKWNDYATYFKKIIQPETTTNEGNDLANSRKVLAKEFEVSRFMQMQIYHNYSNDENMKEIFKAIVYLYILSIKFQVKNTLKTPSKVKNYLIKKMRENNLFSFEVNVSNNIDKFKSLLSDFYKDLKEKEKNYSKRDHLNSTLLKQQIIDILSLDGDSKRITRYIMIDYENSRRDSPIPASINFDNNYELEHICPSSPAKESPEYNFSLTPNFKQIINEIGNGLIISKELNGKTSNRSVQTKLLEYKKEQNKTKMLEEFLNYLGDNTFGGKNISRNISKRTKVLANNMVTQGLYDIDKILGFDVSK